MTESRDVAANQVPSSVVCAITHAPASGVLAPDDTADIVGIDLHGGWSCRCASGRVTTHVNRNTERPVLPGFCGIGSSAVPLGAMSESGKLRQGAGGSGR